MMRRIIVNTRPTRLLLIVGANRRLRIAATEQQQRRQRMNAANVVLPLFLGQL